MIQDEAYIIPAPAFSLFKGVFFQIPPALGLFNDIRLTFANNANKKVGGSLISPNIRLYVLYCLLKAFRSDERRNDLGFMVTG